MNICKHEIKQNFKTLLIWSIMVGGLSAIFMLMFRSLAGEMSKMAESYANMGGLTAAFGMDQLSMATPLGYYGIEGGAMLSICGAMFAAMTGIGVLAKEEHSHTAEFLLTHPVSRGMVAAEKLLYVIVQVIIFNLIYTGLSVLSFQIIDANIEWQRFSMFQLAQLLMHLEVAGICFGCSAFMKRQSAGIGLGFAATLYFMGMMYQVSDGAAVLKYITPFVYSDAGTVIPEGAIDIKLVGIGLAYGAVGVLLGIWRYCQKDIAA